MTTARAVITGALRKLAVVGGVGRRTPSNLEFNDALKTMLSMYRGLITSGAFGRQRDIVPVGDYVAGENQRIFKTSDANQKISLPDMVSYCGVFGYCDDGIDPTYYDLATDTPAIASTDYGLRPYGVWSNGTPMRPVRDGSLVSIVDEFTGEILELIYDGQRKTWFTFTDLDTGEELDETDEWSVKRLNDALDLDVALAHRDLNGLIAYLATLLADEFGADIPAMTLQQSRQFIKGIVGNYSTFKRDDYDPAYAFRGFL